MDDDPTLASIDEVLVFEAVTRDLVGVALRSVERLDVSLPQFRLLFVLHERGPSSSVACARSLGVVGSSVTRLADRLCESGHLARGSDPANRSVVTLELTVAGRRVVQQVIDHRRRELAEAIGALDPEQRAAGAQVLANLHRILAGADSDGERHRHLPI